MFNVDKIEGENSERLVNDIFNLKDIQLNYATTSQKYQGKDINEKFNIFDLKRHSKETLYTALSRATDIKNIHLNTKEIKKEYLSDYKKLIFNEISSENLIGEIYLEFCNITGNYYIGMTTRNNNIRFEEHIKNKDCVVSVKMENPQIQLIGVAIGNESLIRKFERNYIIEYKEKYGEN